MRHVTGTLQSRALVWSRAMPRFTGGRVTDRHRRHHGHERRRLITGDAQKAGACRLAPQEWMLRRDIVPTRHLRRHRLRRIREGYVPWPRRSSATSRASQDFSRFFERTQKFDFGQMK
jgi:hypothetical protein